MDLAAAYRKRAAEERAKAEAAPLANRRVMYERAAEMWDTMALQAQETADRTVVNEAAKAAR